MITVIHGDDQASSRNDYYSEKKKAANPLIFDGEKVLPAELIQAFDSGGLFAQKQRVFIEGFFSKKRSDSEIEGLISYLKKNKSGNDIFFWEAKVLPQKYLSFFPNAQVRIHKIPKVLFYFLDGVKPFGGKELTILFHKTLETVKAELVFFMLIRQLRLLLAFSDAKSFSQIEELRALAPWQKSKLERQSRLFSENKLKEMYRKLFEIDVAQKTGASPLSLIQSIDFWLLEI